MQGWPRHTVLKSVLVRVRFLARIDHMFSNAHLRFNLSDYFGCPFEQFTRNQYFDTEAAGPALEDRATPFSPESVHAHQSASHSLRRCLAATPKWLRAAFA